MVFAVNAGVRINCEIVGDGPPIVLHVAYLGRPQAWARDDVVVVQNLERDDRLNLLDRRGFGASDKPHDRDAYLPAPVVADVVAVVDDLGVGRAHFWGYSRGGRVGFALARVAPRRFPSLVIGGASPYAEDRSLARRPRNRARPSSSATTSLAETTPKTRRMRRLSTERRWLISTWDVLASPPRPAASMG